MIPLISYTMFIWSGGPLSSGVGFFCFVSPRAWKQKKPTPLDRCPPLHVNRPLDGSENSLKAAIQILRDFSKISGSKLNDSKTEALWIVFKIGHEQILVSGKKFKWPKYKVKTRSVAVNWPGHGFKVEVQRKNWKHHEAFELLEIP